MRISSWARARAHPVYTIERGRLTGEQALALLNGLFPGDLELRVNRDSREELLYDMRRVRRGYFVDVDEGERRGDLRPL